MFLFTMTCVSDSRWMRQDLFHPFPETRHRDFRGDPFHISRTNRTNKHGLILYNVENDKFGKGRCMQGSLATNAGPRFWRSPTLALRPGLQPRPEGMPKSRKFTVSRSQDPRPGLLIGSLYHTRNEST